jgi:hypothetical protein
MRTANALLFNGGPNTVYRSRLAVQLVAVLQIDDNVGIATRTVFIVTSPRRRDADCGSIHTQALVQSSTATPALQVSQGSESLAFVFSATTMPNEVQNLNIFRSDNGDLVMGGPFTVSGLNGTVGAELTAAELIMTFPNQFNDGEQTMPRPRGECDIVDPTLDSARRAGARSTLATTTRTATLRNTGLDCLVVEDIADSAPYALTAAARALLPATIEPGDEVDFDIALRRRLSNNINRTPAATLDPRTATTRSTAPATPAMPSRALPRPPTASVSARS